MAQDVKVTFQGLPLTQQAIDGMDLKEIQKLKDQHSTGDYKLCYILGSISAAASVVSTVITGIQEYHGNLDYFYPSLAVGFCVNAVSFLAVAKKSKQKNKELDVIEYIKSGDITKVKHSDTPFKAANAGMKIG